MECFQIDGVLFSHFRTETLALSSLINKITQFGKLKLRLIKGEFHRPITMDNVTEFLFQFSSNEHHTQRFRIIGKNAILRSMNMGYSFKSTWPSAFVLNGVHAHSLSP